MKNQYIGSKMSKKGGLSRAKLGGEGGRPSVHFFENQKKVLWFWKKGSNCVRFHESSIQNAVLMKIIQGKMLQNFTLQGIFFIVFLMKLSSKCLTPQNLPCPEKCLVVRLLG